MANIQRLLGTMLASRMAGRGGMGGALGSAAMMGLGGPLLRSKAGLAAMGYLAYRSYRQNQQGQPQAGQPGAMPESRQASAAGDQGSGQGSGQGGAFGGLGGGGIGGAIGGLIDSLTGGRQGSDQGGGQGGGQSLGDRIAAAIDGRGPAPEPEETLSENKALLLIRAMIAAAASDGTITPAERDRICGKLKEAGADEEDKRLVERELENPRSLDVLLRDVNDVETAQQFYLASRVAIEGATPTQKSYLAYLRQRLNLPDEDVETVEKLTA